MAKPPKMATRDKVRREDRRVPAGNHRRGEVERHDGVHREHQRRRERRQEQVSHLVVPPLAIAAAPAEREEAVREGRELIAPGPGAVAQRGEVGDQAREPEQHRYREIGRNREHVPEQRRPEVRPDGVQVGHGSQEPRHPNASDVQAGVETGADDGKEGHRLGGAVDRRAPFLAGEEQNPPRSTCRRGRCRSRTRSW